MTEARYGDDGRLDEVVSDTVATFHLEQMDKGRWWIGLTHPDGSETHITLYTARRAEIFGGCEIFEGDD